MIELVLYSTSGCHLCDMALEVIAFGLQGQGWRLEEIEISESDHLIERYGVRIPVVRLANKGDCHVVGGDEWELGWPFEPAQVIELVKRGYS
ncbi:MAG: glutaredoxin family protein [Hahellaceae bacterium]|nr:glutaredoxin family protein [Hahellaceae bacterium]